MVLKATPLSARVMGHISAKLHFCLTAEIIEFIKKGSCLFYI
jgi:hypothetical protein